MLALLARSQKHRTMIKITISHQSKGPDFQEISRYNYRRQLKKSHLTETKKNFIKTVAKIFATILHHLKDGTQTSPKHLLNPIHLLPKKKEIHLHKMICLISFLLKNQKRKENKSNVILSRVLIKDKPSQFLKSKLYQRDQSHLSQLNKFMFNLKKQKKRKLLKSALAPNLSVLSSIVSVLLME